MLLYRHKWHTKIVNDILVIGLSSVNTPKQKCQSSRTTLININAHILYHKPTEDRLFYRKRWSAPQYCLQCKYVLFEVISSYLRTQSMDFVSRSDAEIICDVNDSLVQIPYNIIIYYNYYHKHTTISNILLHWGIKMFITISYYMKH